jgi:tRNA (cytidine/uridine-2'-O-)-methyltransferase
MYQPDIPQNTGAMMRLCACLNIPLDIIEPCGFPWDKKKIGQSAMDYFDAVSLTRHDNWDQFKASAGKSRIILMTTKGAAPHHSFTFQPDDIVLAGRESAGVPDFVHAQADARIVIPMENAQRSLNIVNATALIIGEALGQTRWRIKP